MTKDGKTKILQFPVANSKGGITQYILQNWKFIDKSKFHFDFATMSKTLDFEEEIKKEGSDIFYISCYAEENEEQFKKEFREILQRGEYDIVHLHTKQWKSTFVEEIANELGISKVIVHAHSTGIDTLDEQKRNKEIQLHNEVLQHLDETIATDFWACSELAAEFLYGDKISKDQVVIMNNAIELQKFAYNEKIRADYRKRLGIRDDEIVIGNVGRFVYQKNQEFLLKVFKELCEIRNDFRLLIVGTGELEMKLKKFVEENNLNNKVIFLGFRKDVNCLLQVFDIFCLPSRFEGFPISLVEAHVSGVRCIVSNTITKEIELSDLVSRIPLEEDVWIEEICKFRNYDRVMYAELTSDLGYDINRQILKLEKNYEISK